MVLLAYCAEEGGAKPSPLSASRARTHLTELPFKTLFTPPEPGKAERWIKALETIGVDGVQARLIQDDVGTGGASRGVGSEQLVTKWSAEA
jgi:hypothetical protein